MHKESDSTYEMNTLSKIMDEIKQLKLQEENTKTQLLEVLQGILKQLDFTTKQIGQEAEKTRTEIIRLIEKIQVKFDSKPALRENRKERRLVRAKAGQEYEVYTNKDKKGSMWSEEDVENLREEFKESLQKGKTIYEIWADDEKDQILIQGKRSFPSDDLKKLLYLFLKNVGSYCTFVEIGEEVWGNEFVKAGTIHQKKKRLCDLTDGVLTPHIVGKSERYYVIERPKEGVKQGLTYCLLLLAKKPGDSD